jgi:predicted O-methyltransferase YrrM
MRPEVRRRAVEAKGFLAEEEGQRLFELALELSPRGLCLEMGSYCGKSTLYLAEGCRLARGHPLVAVDHHRGSPEHQPGEESFDPDLYDEPSGRVSTFGAFESNLLAADLGDWVVPVVASSEVAGRALADLSFALVFIDGSHSLEEVRRDFASWAPRIAPGGCLAVHDLFDDPCDGGQGPVRVFESYRDSPDWGEEPRTLSLGILRRR